MLGNIKTAMGKLISEYDPIDKKYFDGEARSNLISLGYGLCREASADKLRTNHVISPAPTNLGKEVARYLATAGKGVIRSNSSTIIGKFVDVAVLI